MERPSCEEASCKATASKVGEVSRVLAGTVRLEDSTPPYELSRDGFPGDLEIVLSALQGLPVVWWRVIGDMQSLISVFGNVIGDYQ